jgi:maltose O-acetyltransferase
LGGETTLAHSKSKVVLDCTKVFMGSNVMLAPEVQIYTAYHPLDAETRRSGLEMAEPITIGDDV